MSYSNRVNIHGYCSSSIYYFINCTFAPFFFSLFSVLNKLSNFSSPHLLLFPQMHTNTPTHKHIHTEINLLKKKKKNTDTQTHPHTNKPTQTNNKEIDQCLTGTIKARGSCLIGAHGYGSCLIKA